MKLCLKDNGFIKDAIDISVFSSLIVNTTLIAKCEYELIKNEFSFISYKKGNLLVGKESSRKHKNLVDIIEYVENATDEKITSIYRLPDDDVIKLIESFSTDVFAFYSESNNKYSNRSHNQFLKTYEKALELGCNDIHIQCIKGNPGRSFAKFKVDGEFSEYVHNYVDFSDGYEMLKAVFDSLGEKEGNDDLDDRTIQETTFTYPNNSKDDENNNLAQRKLRFTKTVPMNGDVVYAVIRIMGKSKKLNDLGISKEEREIIIRAVNSENGMIITSGPTSSGKTTFMTASILEFPKSKSLQTIEDPIELSLPDGYEHILQNALNGSGYGPQVRAILRQDIDGVLIGEIRDSETCGLAIEGARNGHLCLTTTHSNSAIGIVSRLAQLGASSEDLSEPSVLNLLMSQRLEKLLCESCKIKCENSQALIEIINSFDINASQKYFTKNKNGCVNCNYTGYGNRTLVVEFIEINDNHRRYIKNNDILGWKSYLKDNGHTFLIDKMINLVENGKSCPFDIYLKYSNN